MTRWYLITTMALFLLNGGMAMNEKPKPRWHTFVVAVVLGIWAILCLLETRE